MQCLASGAGGAKLSGVKLTENLFGVKLFCVKLSTEKLFGVKLFCVKLSTEKLFGVKLSAVFGVWHLVLVVR